MKRKARLLIVDDELDAATGATRETRRAQYKKLEDQFDLVLVERAGDLSRALKGNLVDAALVDFVLDNMGLDIRTVLREIGSEISVFLISQSWSLAFDKLASIIPEFPVARLFTWEDMETPRGREMVAFWVGAAVAKRQELTALDLDPDESIRLVQLSDLQFNAVTQDTRESDTQVALLAIQTQWARAPHFIAMTGDIAEQGRPKEYEMAFNWLDEFRGKLARGGAPIEILTIPGNHDISWPLALASRVDGRNRLLNNEKILFEDLRKYAFQPFREFSQRVESPDRWKDQRSYWVSGAFRHLGLVLFGLNSSEEMDEWATPSRKLSDRTLGNLFSEIRNFKATSPDALIVGFIHHPLAHSDENIVNSINFRRHVSNSTGSVVIFTGHVHEQTTFYTAQNNDPGILQIGGATLTLNSEKRPQDSLRGFNAIEFRRQNDSIISIDVTSHAFFGHKLQSSVASYVRHPDGRISG
jgi:3',5'-cyclic AMP phosphodiesterase CpdA